MGTQLDNINNTKTEEQRETGKQLAQVCLIICSIILPSALETIVKSENRYAMSVFMNYFLLFLLCTLFYIMGVTTTIRSKFKKRLLNILAVMSSINFASVIVLYFIFFNKINHLSNYNNPNTAFLTYVLLETVLSFVLALSLTIFIIPVEIDNTTVPPNKRIKINFDLFDVALILMLYFGMLGSVAKIFNPIFI
jgi:hypothetical protein